MRREAQIAFVVLFFCFILVIVASTLRIESLKDQLRAKPVCICPELPSVAETP